MFKKNIWGNMRMSKYEKMGIKKVNKQTWDNQINVGDKCRPKKPKNTKRKKEKRKKSVKGKTMNIR